MAKKRILIVEDERPLAHALELKLMHEGFETTIVTNGQACLDITSKEKFSIILLDLMMPLMDGFQVLEKLSKYPAAPVVFVLSNLSQHEDETRALSLGARKFFIKSNTPLNTIVDEVSKV